MCLFYMSGSLTGNLHHHDKYRSISPYMINESPRMGVLQFTGADFTVQ